MTRVKLCGMMRPEDIQAVNEIKPEYIGFVFAKKSRRYVSKEQAKMLKEMLDPAVKAVGVFVNEPVENVADLLNEGIVDMAQLHGVEDEAYICRLRELTGRGEDTFIIKAVQVKSEADVKAGEQSGADLVLFDAGAGDGKVFNWKLLENVKRPYFLAGGLDPENVRDAVERLRTYSSWNASNPTPTSDSLTLLMITEPSRPAFAEIWNRGASRAFNTTLAPVFSSPSSSSTSFATSFDAWI